MAKRNNRHRNVFAMIESRMSKASVRRSDVKARKMLLALRLTELRKAMKKDQASVKGFSQPDISKIEGRGDIRLSTLVDYCKGLGADLKITARPQTKGAKEFVLLKAS